MHIQFVSRPRLGNHAIIPSKRRVSSAANQTLYDNSFAVQGLKLWNAVPYHLNVIQDFQHFKKQLTKFMLSLPDKPLHQSGAIHLHTPTLCCAGMTSKTLLFALGWSEDVMALSKLDETLHRSHR